jgi:hypothetical protein
MGEVLSLMHVRHLDKNDENAHAASTGAVKAGWVRR